MIAGRIAPWPPTAADMAARHKNRCPTRKIAGFALGYTWRTGRRVIDGGAAAARQ